MEGIITLKHHYSWFLLQVNRASNFVVCTVKHFRCVDLKGKAILTRKNWELIVFPRRAL